MWQFWHSKYSRVVGIGFDQAGIRPRLLPMRCSFIFIIVQNHVLLRFKTEYGNLGYHLLLISGLLTYKASPSEVLPS